MLVTSLFPFQQISPQRHSTPARRASPQRRPGTSPSRRTTARGRVAKPSPARQGAGAAGHHRPDRDEYMDYDVDRTDVRADDYMNIRDSYDAHVSLFTEIPVTWSLKL